MDRRHSRSDISRRGRISEEGHACSPCNANVAYQLFKETPIVGARECSTLGENTVTSLIAKCENSSGDFWCARAQQDMQVAKEKLSNLASSAKEHVNIYKAKVEEKLERARARNKEEKNMAKERRKVKEASAKMGLHKAKARHAEKKLGAKLSHGHGTVNYHHPPPAPLHNHQHQHEHHHLGTTNMIPASNPHVYVAS